ncbi:unnamed protein product [Kluyveromyces dobzhanskii CBS 2104]|uniref:WGS project CCBQ000000000 data, contig 00015 n=1 Tax=Kluyveromyces dobzhanskii CBS 2104 TaxID=1427455 RepID=A0A0A8LCD2_9SACH|nr:unnamed protein product [Kluyveromyces dobzhanskii CBS 2104]
MNDSTDSFMKNGSSVNSLKGPHPLLYEDKESGSHSARPIDQSAGMVDNDEKDNDQQSQALTPEAGGFISKVSTKLENYQRESALLNTEKMELPVYDNDLFDPLARPVTQDATSRHSTCPKDSGTVETSTEIDNDGLYNSDDIVDPPPDGGYGWICCACVAVMNFCTWGPNTCYGVFLSYYLSSSYFPHATPTDFAVIGGLMIGLTLILLPVAAMFMNKFGYRVVMLSGVLLQFTSFISSSFVRTIGELYFTYGILLGFANGLIFGCNSIVIPGWFLKKRAFANGVTHIGVGLGGLVLSFIVHAIMEKTGSHKWPMRFLGIMALVLNTIAALIVKIRVPRNQPPKKSALELFKDVYDYNVYKSIPLQYSTVWSTMTSIGYVILLFSLSNYALSIGLSTSQATATLAIFNGAQIIGRPAMGYFSEKIGRVNCTLFCMFYTIILLGPFWFNVETYSEIMGFSFLLGLGAGISSVNTVPLVADVTGMAHFPAGLGYNNIWNGSLSVVAEIFALKLRDYSLAQPYLYCQIFVLVMYFVGLLALIPYREWKVTRMLNARIPGKKVDEGMKLKWQNALKPGIINYFRRAFYPTRC